VISRRTLIQLFGSLGIYIANPFGLINTATTSPILRNIPKSGESIPAIGMGTWLTFGIGGDVAARQIRVKILQEFFKKGGAMIDSSPMYGTSEEVIGHCLKQIKDTDNLFAATKVWTTGWQAGIRQMLRSQHRWGIKVFDLIQIHNLLDWEVHLETLEGWKAEGRIRYIGITTSHGRRHDELQQILKHEDAIDFVQFTYNIEDREAEQYLLPLATERKIAVIINRPFQAGNLFNSVQGKPLPAWASEFDCQNWAQFFLKFIISHPAVTCAIPATSRVDHMQQNMGALYGRLPDAKTRQKMIKLFVSL